MWEAGICGQSLDHIVRLALRFRPGTADDRVYPEADARRLYPERIGRLMKIGHEALHARDVGLDREYDVGVADGELLSATGTASLEQHGPALRRRRDRADRVAVEELSFEAEAVHPGRLGVDALLAVGDDRHQPGRASCRESV